MATGASLKLCLSLKHFNNFQVFKRVKSNILKAAWNGTRSFCAPSSSVTEDDRDALCRYHENLYSSPRVQHLLSQITGYETKKVFRARPGPLKAPRYKFMTDEELKQAQNQAEQIGYQKLTMPLYFRRKEKPADIISKDPEIQSLIPNNLVCVDISPGQRNWSRTIVVRQPDGILREATFHERVRVNQVYFPRAGREIEMPSKFLPEHLQNVLNKEDFLSILEQACRQFEPEDPNFARVTESTFEHIAKMKKFDVLRSTRHFGPMTFYLVREKNVEGLMIDMIQRLLVDDAVGVVELYCLVHTPEMWKELSGIEDKVQILKVFAKEHYKEGGELELLVQSLKEGLKQQEIRN